MITKSDNAMCISIKEYYQNNDCTIFYSPIVHKSILKCINACNNSILLKVNNDGLIDIHDLEEWLDVCINKPFVVIDYVSNEINTKQNIDQIIKIIHLYNGVVYLEYIGNKSTISSGDINEIEAETKNA